MPIKKYLAELIATFALTFVVSATLLGDLPVATPVAAALTVGLFVYMVGGVSGAHINPAITVALATLQKISPLDAVMYIVSQVLGALLAMMAALAMFGKEVMVVAENSYMVMGAEILGAFMLGFGVATAVKNGNDNTSGLIVGSSLLVGILAAAGVSNGILNPAVAFGLGSLSVAYIAGPIIGAVCAMWVHKFMTSK